MLLFEIVCNVVNVFCLLVVASAFVITVKYEIAELRQRNNIVRTHGEDTSAD